MNTQNKKALTVKEIAVFAMLGALMLSSKKLMEVLPNVHLIGMLTVTFTLVYRRKALIPLYIYILLDGLFSGFGVWWIPYLYIWAILWAVTMALPKNMPKKAQFIVYPIVCGLHGLLFGTLYAPAWAIISGLSLKEMWAWIVAGLPYDGIHAVSNFAFGLIIPPLVNTIRKAEKQI